MSKPKILIIGCGAVGLSQGYHLSTGAEITYLVRPGRRGAFVPPKRLYDYKKDILRTFEEYRVVESTAEIANEEFYCVFDTLDGHTARSESGAATLRSVGDLIRSVVRTFVVYDAIGIDMDEHYAATMDIPKQRLVLAMSLLAHQPTPSISVPSSAKHSLIEQADLLYSYFGVDTGLVVINKNVELTRSLEAVYHQNGLLKIRRQPTIAGDLVVLAIVQLVVWNIEDWVAWPQLKSRSESWALLLRAQTEVLSLPRFGWTGWFLSWFIGSWITGKMIETPTKDALPLVYHEFNSFHHGNKVIKQDVEVLEELIADGEQSKIKMVALREICRQARDKIQEHHTTAQVIDWANSSMDVHSYQGKMYSGPSG